MEPATRLRKPLLLDILAVVAGGIGRMSVWGRGQLHGSDE
jgi:hypothetical protein